MAKRAAAKKAPAGKRSKRKPSARAQRGVKAATPENPSFSLSDPAAWDALIDGDPSSTGEQVSARRALGFSPWWRGINLLARDCGKLPCHVYQRINDERGEGKSKAPDHPAYYLIRWEPNDFQTALDFREQLTGHAVAGGNGYAWINRLADATPIELLPLDPDSTYPVRANGLLWYVTSVDGELVKIQPDDVLHIHGYSSDGISGLDVVAAAREALGLGIGAQRYKATVLKNGGRPGVVLEHPAKLDEAAVTRLRESWERMHSGISNAHRTAVLDQGMKAHALSFSPQDAQIDLIGKMAGRDVANFLGVPPHKVGDDGRQGYASLEEENQSYHDDSLDYWLCKWESQYRKKLFTEEEKRADSHFPEFLRGAIHRANLAAQAAFFRTALAGQPWMVQDEVRAVFNLNPMGGEAATLKTPLNMGQGGFDNDNNDPAGPTPGRPKKGQ